MKGQVATEYLTIVGIGLFIVTIVFYYTITYSSESVSVNQAKEATDTIANAADYVYSMGVGSQTTIVINLPNRIVESHVENKEILFKLGLKSGITDVYSITKGEVSGSLPTRHGRHYITLNMTDDGVYIKEY
ncbi:MAG: hypothetical protein ACTSVB_01960 [Candidatus Heimdallarchaeaceae archaeon]